MSLVTSTAAGSRVHHDLVPVSHLSYELRFRRVQLSPPFPLVYSHFLSRLPQLTRARHIKMGLNIELPASLTSLFTLFPEDVPAFRGVTDANTSCPSFWGPGSELIGRRSTSFSTRSLYTVFHIGQVRANSMTSLLVAQFPCGFFAASPLTSNIRVINEQSAQSGQFDPILGSRTDDLLRTCVPDTSRPHICLRTLWYCAREYNQLGNTSPLSSYVPFS
ncbi:hypothetical protein H4582DRAFT_2051336 [Lactarius indigo]|nr:hypothetical protein H4582DRAFT_2051336 [Lactarius indigo]